MATITREKQYHCFNDCRQEGCPTHKAVLTFQSTSNAYTFDNGKGDVRYFEEGELQTFIDLLKDLDRADAVDI
jgi:hypothetical protein